jgi:hypothetical protein
MKVETYTPAVLIPLTILAVDQNIGFHAAYGGSADSDNPVLKMRGMPTDCANVGIYRGFPLAKRGSRKQENEDR